MNQSWLDKYKPTKSKDVIGQKTAIKKITQFLLNKRRTKNCIVLTGKNGIGKTLLADVLLKELGFNIKQIDDDHDLKMTMNISTFFNRKQQKVAIIYESEYVKKLADDIKLFSKSTQPIIFICDTQELEKYKIIKKCSEIVYMRSPYVKEQVDFLTNILNKEKIKIPINKIEDACKQSQGDMRFLIQNSDFWRSKLNENEKDVSNFNIFKMVSLFFDYNNTTKEKADDFFIDTNYLPQLLFFNYPNVKIAKVDSTYDKLKKELIQDMLKNRIKKAKEESKKIGVEITKVKKPKPTEEDVTAIYKLNTFADTIDLMSTADIINQNITSKQHFSLLPSYKYIMSSATTNCSGMLLEKDIRYTKPKTIKKFEDFTICN